MESRHAVRRKEHGTLRPRRWLQVGREFKRILVHLTMRERAFNGHHHVQPAAAGQLGPRLAYPSLSSRVRKERAVSTTRAVPFQNVWSCHSSAGVEHKFYPLESFGLAGGLL
jgi:hypothetical protein